MAELPSSAQDISFQFDGRSIPAVSGEPVGVALLRAGVFVLARSVKYHRPRGLFCLAGHCGNCLVRAGGNPDRLACTEPARDGLEVQTQNALPTAGHDLLRTIDWVFPKGMDPHEMFAGVPVAGDVLALVARRMAGLGELPDTPVSPLAQAPEVTVDVALVGLGQAGRAVAQRLAGTGGRAVALDQDPLADPVLGVDCWIGAQAFGLYRDGGRPLLAVRRGEAIVRLRAERVVLCTGSRDQPLLFDGNDLPGILGGRAVRRLLLRHGLLPARSALVVGDGPEAKPLTQALLSAGAEVAWAAERPEPLPGLRPLAGQTPRRALGRGRVTGMRLGDERGGETRWKGGLVALCGPRAAAFELGAHAGARVAPLGLRGFPIDVDERGRTSVPWLFAAGSCTNAPLDSPAQAPGVAAGLGEDRARLRRLSPPVGPA
ncbi:MAG: 2Fe-2S iron-sulfur cluster-binding protein [Deltaproteobacteria bacterium]